MTLRDTSVIDRQPYSIVRHMGIRKENKISFFSSICREKEQCRLIIMFRLEEYLFILKMINDRIEVHLRPVVT